MTSHPKIEAVKAHYEKYPYPSYPWYARARWKDLEAVDFAKWEVKRGVRDAWICGCGTIAPLMFGRRNPRVKIIAGDLSARSLRQLKWRLFLYGIRNVQTRKEDLMQVGYREEFDAVDCTGVLHHLPEPVAGLRKLADAMRPQAVLRLMLYSREARLEIEAMREDLSQKSVDSLEQARTYLKENKVEATGDLASPSGLADALLHPLVWTYRRAEVEALIAEVPSLRIRSLHEKGNFIVFCEKH